MRSSIYKLDYVGFTFNNIHSSQLGIKSVTSGNRYSHSLLPTFQDYSIDIVGGDGSYYFGNTFKQKDFDLNIAFDDVTEQELRDISRWLYATGTISTLIFDERPYIKYYVKITKQPVLKYLAFEDSTGARVYKGEGSLTFTAFDPFGYSVNKFLESYDDENIGEWVESSGLLHSQEYNGVDYYDIYAAGVIPLYNPGDLPVDFILTLVVGGGAIPKVSLDSSTYFKLDLTSLGAGTVTIDTKKKLIKHGTTVVNYVLLDGDFFKIPLSTIVSNSSQVVGTGISLTITNVTGASIVYTYKYL